MTDYDDPYDWVRDEERTERDRAYDDPDLPDDRDLADTFPDTPPHTRRRTASDHARNYR